MIVDIGPQTRMSFYNEILKTKILLWNGPLGLFEKNHLMKEHVLF